MDPFMISFLKTSAQPGAGRPTQLMLFTNIKSVLLTIRLRTPQSKKYMRCSAYDANVMATVFSCIKDCSSRTLRGVVLQPIPCPIHQLLNLSGCVE